jgi:hypothetical protein
MTTLITIECEEPMGRDELAQQPWSDVRISFVTEPGGETCEFEPTLVSRPRLEQDLRYVRERQLKHPERDRFQTIALLEKIIELFDNGGRFYVDETPEGRISEIYTNHPHIDREETERMLVHFLETIGLTEVGFQWVWPEFICSVG